MGKRLKRFVALVRKETIQVLRDRSTLAMILVLPLIELFLFAYAVDMTVDHIPTAVADMSLDAQSRAFLDALQVSGYFDIEIYVESEAQVIQAIDKGRVRAGVVIPPDLATQVERGRGQVLMLLDGSDSFTVQSGYSAAVAVAQAQAMELMVEQVSRMGASAGSLPIESSITAVNMMAMAVVRERELGTIEQLLTTPIRPMELMVGKMVPNIVIASISMLSIILFGVLWFGVPFQGDPWLFAWLSLLFLASALGMGLLISTVAQTQRQAQQITMLLMLLSMLLTGFIYPRTPMPPAVRAVGDMIPLTYFVRIVRGIITKGVGLSFIWNDVLSLAIYGAVVMIISAATFKKRLD
ncbi:MAG: hypothetical protein B6I35_13255 [Anaerolineaceae bacterium 4572_32.2]|nr:MAG: hypothetical protein B6I35_13255 [Anaerolineaceae bacterium 4572_32.2]